MDGMLWLVLTVGTPMDKVSGCVGGCSSEGVPPLQVKADGKVHRIVLQLSADLATIRWHTVGAIYNSRKRTYPLEKVHRPAIASYHSSQSPPHYLRCLLPGQEDSCGLPAQAREAHRNSGDPP